LKKGEKEIPQRLETKAVAVRISS